MHRLRRSPLRFRFSILVLINVALLFSISGFIFFNSQSEPGKDLLSSFWDPTRSGSNIWLLILVGFFIISVLYAILLYRSITVPLNYLRIESSSMQPADSISQLRSDGSDEIAVLARSLNTTFENLSNGYINLKRKFDQQEEALYQYQVYLQAAVELARASTSIPSIEDFLNYAVNLIKENFDLYFVGLYVLDSSGGEAPLCAGTGNAGKLMLEKAHGVKTGEVGLVGSVLASGIVRVVNDVEKDFAYHVSPFLGDTRSEAVFPLKSGSELVGVLDAHSENAGYFDSGTSEILKIMVDQLGVALRNTGLFSGLHADLIGRSSQSRDDPVQLILSQLSSFGGDMETGGDNFTIPKTLPPESVLDELRKGQAVITHQGDGEKQTILYMPLKTLTKVIGYIGLENPSTGFGLEDEETVQALDVISDQIAMALDARVNREIIYTQIERERLVAELSAKLYNSLDVDTVIKLAVKGIQEILNLQDVTIVLGEDLVRSDEEHV